MFDVTNLAIVVDHGYELGGQKQLAKGVDGNWYIWTWLDRQKPKTFSFPTEIQAKEAYEAIKLEKTTVIYTPRSIPCLVNVNDTYWSEIKA
jgi:hypothetical protein